MYAHQLVALLPMLATLVVESNAMPLYLQAKAYRHAVREVPQGMSCKSLPTWIGTDALTPSAEHSHNQFLATVRASLATNNPSNIEDPVFGLLGSAAAAAGQGLITNVDCLQMATADQAFTNAKAANDVAGMTAALVYRALERNTGSVGLASVTCNETAVNPEIAAISQHQDPASTGAAATNKAITLALASQIASIGGDPQTALKSGTFAPGTIGDTTGAGNTCDDANDATGCIFTQNKLVEDATAAEISAAVASISESTAAAAATASGGAKAAAGVGILSLRVTFALAYSFQTGAAATTSAAVVSTAVVVPTTEACGAASAANTDVAAASATSTAAASSSNAAAAASTAAATGTTAAAATGIDVGSCSEPASSSHPASNVATDASSSADFSMTFAAGLDGRAATEFSFEPTDLTNFNHDTALNPEIISQFMCDTFVNACGKSASTQNTCATVKSGIDAQLTAGTLGKNQTYADAWLSGVSLSCGPSGSISELYINQLETAFGITSTGTGTGSAAAGSSAAAGTAAAVNSTAATDAVAAASSPATASTSASTKVAKAKATKTASTAIAAASSSDCTGATASAKAAKAAKTNAAAASSSTSAAGSTATASTVAAASNSTTAATSSSNSTTAASGAGNNVQTFTGALNGVAATPVLQSSGDRPFSVNGDTFVGEAAALQRSCSEQFNGCADAANSGSGASTVAECQTQETSCNAAAA
ncbi:hypothetical protein P7C73_g2829, partial [Tremellales sp. Uapishka_1]